MEYVKFSKIENSIGLFSVNKYVTVFDRLEREDLLKKGLICFFSQIKYEDLFCPDNHRSSFDCYVIFFFGWLVKGLF